MFLTQLSMIIPTYKNRAYPLFWQSSTENVVYYSITTPQQKKNSYKNNKSLWSQRPEPRSLYTIPPCIVCVCVCCRRPEHNLRSCYHCCCVQARVPQALLHHFREKLKSAWSKYPFTWHLKRKKVPDRSCLSHFKTEIFQVNNGFICLEVLPYSLPD